MTLSESTDPDPTFFFFESATLVEPGRKEEVVELQSGLQKGLMWEGRGGLGCKGRYFAYLIFISCEEYMYIVFS